MVKANTNQVSDQLLPALGDLHGGAGGGGGGRPDASDQNPTLTPDTVKARLMVSADKWADASGNADPLTYGAGYLDIPAALNCTVVATEPAISPSLYQDSSGNLAVAMDRAVWGTRALWGTRAIWGTGTSRTSGRSGAPAPSGALRRTPAPAAPCGEPRASP